MKTIIFSCIALSLPFLGRFEELTVFRNGKIIYEQATYGQILTGSLLFVAAVVLLIAAWKESKKSKKDSVSRLVRFTPALFALPAAWQNWSVSQFGNANTYTEIKSGLGGPMANLLIFAAAGLFISADAYWRQKKEA